MRICDISPLTLETLKAIHRSSGFDYVFPRDFETPLFPVRRAIQTDDGQLMAAVALKVEAEAYLWMDHAKGSPEERMQALGALHGEAERQARIIGFDQVHCVLPPEVAERFGKRLLDLGWEAARPWPLYTYQLR